MSERYEWMQIKSQEEIRIRVRVMYYDRGIS